MALVPTRAFLLLLACSLPWVAAQLCDDNPLANNGIKINMQASTSCLKGRTLDMKEVGTCQDNSAHDIQLPFAFKFLDRSYSGSGSGGVFVSSNSYVTFGGSSAAFSGLGPRTPALPTFFIGGRDNALRNLSVGPDALGWRVRFEGWSRPALVNTHNCSLVFPPSIEWELIFLRNSTLQLCTGTLMDHMTSVSAVSDGVSESLVQKFTLTPSTSYTIVTGLGVCECDNSMQVSQGVKITSRPSQTCMKGRTPDMIDVRSCQRAGSTSILLPFPFPFLGRTYGGQRNDVFVGDSSFVTFGGADSNFYSSFEADVPDLPALLIGARQNVLKTLSVAPDPLGWRVRYEGWSNHGASLDPYPTLLQAFSCSTTSLAANITWELIFLFDGSMQLCTSSLMGNIDPAFDSFAIKDRICSSNFSSSSSYFCTNFFQNLSSMSAVIDGRFGTVLQKFNLAPSTLYTISTSVLQCSTACDSNWQVNKGVKITSQYSTSCLKGATVDMTDVGRCSDSDFFSARLPFSVKFLDRSYSGADIFVGSNSHVTFGDSATTLTKPSIPALLIGYRDNALKRLSVGPDPLGWRVRFEGWDRFLSLYRTIDCRRPASVIWELLFMFNSTIQLCTSPFMSNTDETLKPRSESAVWDGLSFVANISLASSRLYSISTGLPPCSLDVSLSSPVASVNGSSLLARFPFNLNISRYDSVTLAITLQGAGFTSAPNNPISLLVWPASSRAMGTASIVNSASSTPLLVVSLRGVANCSIVSLTLPSVTTPLHPQSSRTNISFSVSDPNGNIVFTSASGSLVEIVRNAIAIEAGQPVLELTNNAIRSFTTINISLIPNIMNIPVTFSPSALVITLVGAGWSLARPAQGRVIKPLGGVFESATMEAADSHTFILKVTWSGAFSISNISSLELLLFNVSTLSAPRLADASIRSAVLSSAGHIIAVGTSGRMDAVVASTMGVGSPVMTVTPPVASATGVRIDVTLTPQPQYQQNINLPARIIITLTGSEFECSIGTIVEFSSPFDAASGTLNISSGASKCILMIGITSGTFLSGYPVSLNFGPCATPSRAQPRLANVQAAMIDGKESIVAASSTGSLSEIVEDFGQLGLLLTENLLSVTLTPQFPVPANSFLVVSLTGVGLIWNEVKTLQFSQFFRGAIGTASVEGRSLESVLNVSFLTQHSANVSVTFTILPVYGGCASNRSDVVSALLDKDGNILAATAKSTFATSMIGYPTVTIQELISLAVNGFIVIPEGTYASKCNCNSRIDENLPSRKPDAPVQMKGTAGRSIIDCSGTGLRCLIVRNSTIHIVDIIFKGGSSPVFVSASNVAAVQAIIDAEGQTSTTQSNQGSRTATFARNSLQKDAHSQSVPLQSFDDHSNLSQNGVNSDDDISSALVSPARKEFGRQLLQSDLREVLAMFNTSADESGGCILVLAPAHSVSLIGVRLIQCSAVYGGGGFFSVGNFDAKSMIAHGNFARQGGGIFVAAPNSTEFEMCQFLNNTVAAFSFSRRPSASFPDPAWAAGAGVWLQRLTKMKQCTFERNLAIAAKTIAGSGPHALGSGMYVYETAKDSLMSGLLFSRSASMCAGSGCYSAGSLFIAISGWNTSIQDVTFNECQVTAIRTKFVMSTTAQVEATGACMSVIDGSAGMLKIEKFRSTNCFARSSYIIFGGCMCFSAIDNALISHVSVFGFNYNASLVFNVTLPFSSCGSGGIVLFSMLKNTIISNFSVDFCRWQCMGENTGAVMHAEKVHNATILSMHVSNIFYFGVIGRLFGGVFYFLPVATIVLTNISIQNSSFVGRSLNGAFIYVGPDSPSRQTSTGLFALRGVFVKNVTSHAESVLEFYRFAPIWNGDGAIAFVTLNIYPMGPNPMTIEMEDLVFQNVSVSCAVDGCTNYGLNYIRTEYHSTPYRAVDNRSQSLYFSNALFDNVQSRCKGFGCSVRGACLASTVRDATLMHIQMKKVTATSDGRGSFSGGTFLFHLHNNPLKSMRIINVTSEDARVFASGAFSTAIGGVIVAIYGNLLLDNVTFLRSHVSCFGSGYRCQSIGGSIAFTSTLVPSNKRENAVFSATIANSQLGDTVVDCSGAFCEATGGAIFAGISYRGPNELAGTGTADIASQGTKVLPLIVNIHNCSIVGNVIRSNSVGAALSGAGISILLSNSTMTNISVLKNVIQSTQSSAFAGGGGIYVSGYDSSVSCASTIIKHNDAGVSGLGGAIFAGKGSFLNCATSTLEKNSALKGGGLFVDSSSASLFKTAVCNNTATDKGGGIFCVIVSSFNATAALKLSSVTVSDNRLLNGQPQSVGAAVYIFGDVFLEVRNGTRFSMNGDNLYSTTEAILSISRQANISDDTVVLCQSGSVLSVAVTEVVNQNIELAGPSIQEQYDTQCNPACLFTPEITPYTASGGFLASCIPCPRGTYSLTASSSSTDTVSSKCRPCPFGAFCNGGSSIGASNFHWGWKISDVELVNRFVLLPSGYACKSNCSSISPCGGNRAGVLCGSCASNFSIAFFSSSCVPSVQCSSWKWVPLIFICITFQFFFSISIIQYWSESDMFQEQERTLSLSRRALEQVSLFQNLSPLEFDAVVSKMELVHFAAQSDVFVQGHPPSFMYIIETGILNVYLHDGKGRDVVTDSLVAPNSVGELSFINRTPCTASVRALVDSDLWRLDQSCLDNVAEDDKHSFVSARQAQYANAPHSNESFETRDMRDDLWQPLSVLMWFYQLAGIMLSVSSPLIYIDGSAASFSIVSFFVNAKPSYQAADVSTQRESYVNASDEGPFQFCVSSTFSYSQLYFATLMYYVLWALLMTLLVQKRVWMVIRKTIIRFMLGLIYILDILSRCKRSSKNGTISFVIQTRKQLLRRQDVEIDILGSVVLKWLITCFSAVASLMMQGTACVRLTGLFDATDELRWIYDGRVACFSDSGELPGRWQVAPAIGVIFVLIAPALLWRAMLGIQRLDENLRSPFQQTLLEAYSGLYYSNARHWMVVMYYQRLSMMVIATYFDSSPFFQGYGMLCLCFIILSMDFLYRPYKSYLTQVLSCACAFCLLAIGGLLLRSQALLSASRSPNFKLSDPSTESDAISEELSPVIGLIIVMLISPAILAIIMQPRARSTFCEAVVGVRNLFGCIVARNSLGNSLPKILQQETTSHGRFHHEKQLNYSEKSNFVASSSAVSLNMPHNAKSAPYNESQATGTSKSLVPSLSSALSKFQEKRKTLLQYSEKSAESLFELHQAVVDSEHEATSLPQGSEMRCHSVNSRGSVDNDGACPSKTSSSDTVDSRSVKTAKIIGPSASRQRRNIDGKSSMADTGRRVKYGTFNVYEKQDDIGLSKASSMTDHFQQQNHTLPVNSAVNQKGLPQPPHITWFDTRRRNGGPAELVVVDVIDRNKQWSEHQPESIESSHLSQPFVALASSKPDRAHSPSPRLQKMLSDVHAPPSVSSCDDDAVTRDSLLGLSPTAAAVQKIRADSKARDHDTTFSVANTPNFSTTAIVTSSAIGDRISSSHIPSDIAHQESAAASTLSRSSRNQSSKRRSNSNWQSTALFKKQIDLAKIRCGDQFEEC